MHMQNITNMQTLPSIHDLAFTTLSDPDIFRTQGILRALLNIPSEIIAY